jgi:hypothetical protein
MTTPRGRWLWFTTSLLVGACAERESWKETPAPEPPADAGTEPDASWETAKTCAGDEVSLASLNETDCERFAGSWSRCKGEASECAQAVDEADCRARPCSWLTAPQCIGSFACGAAESSAQCESLSGCTVTEVRGRCEGDAIPCSFERQETWCRAHAECAWDASTETCSGGDAWQCAELSLLDCSRVGEHCWVKWEDHEVVPFPPEDCRGASDCPADRWCNDDGSCRKKLAEDESCVADAACASGVCRVRHDQGLQYAAKRQCAPAADCTLPGCSYCRRVASVATCFDACDAPAPPCALCGCAAADQTYCDAAAGSCLPKLALSSACAADAQCQSGRCAALSADAPRVCLARGGDACTEADCENCRDGICLAACSEENDCDGGYHCMAAGGASGTCLADCSDSSCHDQTTCRGKESFTTPGDYTLVCVPTASK